MTAFSNSFPYRFFSQPEYKTGRHILVWVAIAIISVNMTFYSNQHNLEFLGNRIYGICLLTFVVFIAVFYLNIYTLIPRFLVPRQYGRYLALLSLSIFTMIWFQTALEYFVCRYWHFPVGRDSYLNAVTLLDWISSFAMDTICITGGSMPILLKHWSRERLRVNEMEKEHISTELTNLKEQANPNLLFNVLHNAGECCGAEPTRASGMLLSLSQILRYQLYDCNRNYVLLFSEIQYLSHYLTLVQLYRPSLQFSVEPPAQPSMILVPPLLFIPFVRYAAGDAASTRVDIQFRTHNGCIDFNCTFLPSATAPVPKFEQIRKRLELLYEKDFVLSVSTAGTIHLKLKTAKP